MGAQASDALESLRPAYHCLDTGESGDARRHAQQSLASATKRGDRLLEAEALLCLSLCDRYASKFSRCLEATLRASRIFEALGVNDREAAALATLSYAAGTLGRYEEAVEASLLAIRLLGAEGDKSAQLTALNYLGVNFFWGQSFDEADAALESSIGVARSCQPELSAFQPMLNLGFSRYFRASTEREHTGQLPPLDALRSSLAACLAAIPPGGSLSVSPGLQSVGHALWNALASICHSWSGDFSAAEHCLADSRKWTSLGNSAAWMHGVGQLAQTELLWARSEISLAEESARRTIRLAARTEHEPIRRMAHCLLGHMYEARGQHELALQSLRALRQREQKIRSDALASRARVVDWQLATRSSEKNVGRLQVLAQHLERVSLEDPLTGLANRRCIEQKLGGLLGPTDSTECDAPCVALIDVDAFKSINDTHSHQVGDRVLTALAEIFSAQVRASDLVGRLAGDEFVVVFAPCDFESAQYACARIHAAVRSHNWSEVAPALTVSVSIGLAKAQAGETMESVLHRSDLAMYQDKATSRGGQIAGGRSP